jgi:predicted porin
LEKISMKKSLIALAALAAVSAASAQSSVSISGLIDTGYAVVNAPAAASDTSGLKNNNTATTVLTIAGTEDLGGGNAAMFKMQLTPDFISGNGVGGSSASILGGNSLTSNTIANNAQEVFLGLSSNTLGSVKLGRVNTNFLDAFSGTGSVFGTALGSAYGSSGNIGTRYAGTAVSTFNSAPTRFNQSIRYETPAFSGFSASLLVVPKIDNVGGAVNAAAATTTPAVAAVSAVSTNRQGVTDIGLKYKNGPLNVVFASQTVKTGVNGVVDLASNTHTTALASNVSNKLNIIAANYNFGATTVYGAFWTEKQDSATAMDASSTMVGVKYALNGTTTLMASYSTSNEKSTANVDKKILGLGADYALSKRTALYARYETRDANTNSAADTTAAGKTTTTAFGVRHTF